MEEPLADARLKKLAKTFSYLDALRESDVTNMFGARPYIVRDLGLDPDVAGDQLSLWMKTFSKEVPPLVRARTALQASEGGGS